VWAALRFGLAHLIMLVPLSAALAIAVAGFAYGQIYRRAYARGLALGDRDEADLRTEAVLAATTWHTAFNSLLVLAVFAGVALGL
jgi:hypothetical protein